MRKEQIMEIKRSILDIIASCEIHDNILLLPPVQLNRTDYLAVNKVLEALGGKWNRKAGGHTFDYDPSEKIEDIILTGEYTDAKKDYQFFPTPPELAEYLCDLTEIDETTTVLEPSCGKGNIADAAWKRNPARLLGIELNDDLKPLLVDKPYEVLIGQDFLSYSEETWDRIVMNPPFSKCQDRTHILKAYELLTPGGILVSVASSSILWRTDNRSEVFRDFLSGVHATIEELDEGAFKESGTMVRTCIVKIRKA